MWYVYTLNNNKNPTQFDPSSVLKIGTRRILVIVEFIARLWWRLKTLFSSLDIFHFWAYTVVIRFVGLDTR
jgi:hypothetical protein